MLSSVGGVVCTVVFIIGWHAGVGCVGTNRILKRGGAMNRDPWNCRAVTVSCNSSLQSLEANARRCRYESPMGRHSTLVLVSCDSGTTVCRHETRR
jgi:hypothetical protein